ncbi:STAS domain-containing protein [Streptomyces sp. NPDC085463]|uniref:STAS domain-containing protein n=1 Tax=Streptomyces sp. NPDC085463 TaxID=3365724 RepID=UPI0037D10D31
MVFGLVLVVFVAGFFWSWVRVWIRMIFMRWESRAVVRVSEEAGVFVVTVSGELDFDEEDLLEASWDEADERRLPATAVDLSAVTFADSAALGVLLDAHDRHRRDGRAFYLVGPLTGAVRLLFDRSSTLDHFTYAASLQQVIDQTKPEA